MDSRIGQAASAQAFKESFHDGSVILTNIRGNTKATGALSLLVSQHYIFSNFITKFL